MFPGLSPEVETLLHCARSKLEPHRADRIKALSQGGLRWASLLWMAERHGLLPLLYVNLSTHDPQAIPKDFQSPLREYVLGKSHWWNECLLQEAIRLFGTFQTHQIPAVLFGETALALSLYGNLTLKRIRTLEFLVRERDLARAGKILISQGYRANPAGSPSGLTATLTGSTRRRFECPDPPHSVFIYHQIGSGGLSLGFDSSSVWQHLRKTPMGGRTVDLPSLEDLLFMLCVRGAEGLWQRMGWVCDVAELIRLNPSMDWRYLLSGTQRIGGERVLSLGLHLAHTIGEAALPQEVLNKIRTDKKVELLGRRIIPTFFSSAEGPYRYLGAYPFVFQMQKRLPDRIRYLSRLGFSPTVADRAWLALPRSLYFLYIPLRPLRLTMTLLRKWKGRFLWGKLLSSPPNFTPERVVERMLELAQVGPLDLVYDLGCGDGRILVRAAQAYSARGIGIEIQPQCIARSRENVRQAGVEHLVTIVEQDAMEVDLSQATVVTLFLGRAPLLRAKLQRELKKGTRIVSVNVDMDGWTPTQTEVGVLDGEFYCLHLWRV